MTIRIRSAVRSDAALILRFVEALADYEKLRHEAKATQADLVRDLFGAGPKVFAELAFSGERPMGFALWYYTYSTFQGRHGIWLEDLFVDPEARGQAPARPCWSTSRNAASARISAASNGPSSTGTSRLSISTRPRVR